MATIDGIILDGIESALRVMTGQLSGVSPSSIDLKASILACRMARELQKTRKEKADKAFVSAVSPEENEERRQQYLQENYVPHENTDREEHGTY